MKNIEIFIFSNEDTQYTINNKRINSIEKDISDDLLVSLNDEELILNEDFEIIEGKILLLNDNNFKIGDKICVTDSISMNVKKVISKNPRDITSNFKVYSSDVKFKFNHNYNISIRYKDEMLTSNFLTKFNPSLIPVSKIRTDCGSFLDGTPDEVIARVIYDNSKTALRILSENEESSSNNNSEETKTPLYVRNYVRYKTDIDLCNAAYMTLSGKAGASSKTVGNISVSSEVKIPYLKDLLKKFEELLKPNEETLTKKFASGKVFKKASNTEYPISNRGIF